MTPDLNSEPALVPRRGITIDAARWLLVPAMAFVICASDRAYLNDFWQHLARGAAMASSGQMIDRDIWTFTAAGRAFRDSAWLTQLAYYRVFEWGGLSAVRVINAFIVAITMGLLVESCRRALGAVRPAMVIGLIALAGLWPMFTIRPQAISMLLFVLTGLLLSASEKRSSLLAIIPIVMLFWVNLHGAFVVQLALIGAWLVGQGWDVLAAQQSPWRDRRTLWLLGCLVFTVLATLVNPYGYHIYLYMLTVGSSGAQRGIEEWLPPTTSSLAGGVFVVSVVMLLVLIGRSPRRVGGGDLARLAVFLIPAFASLRMVPWFLLTAAPVGATILAPMLARARRDTPTSPRPRPLAALAVAGLLLMCVLSLPWLDRINPFLGRQRSGEPVEASLTDSIKGLPVGAATHRIFTRLEWANYLCWSDPGDKVFAEGHIDLYPDSIWSDYLAISDGGARWRLLADRWNIDTMILDRGYHGALLAELTHAPGWRKLGAFGPAVVFVRQPPLPAPVMIGHLDF